MKPDKLRISARQTWHAVEILADSRACLAAKSCVGTRYLSARDPPQLPLPDCSKPADCRCRYRHHEDRRAGQRRDSSLDSTGNMRTLYLNRRQGRGRRAED